MQSTSTTHSTAPRSSDSRAHVPDSAELSLPPQRWTAATLAFAVYIAVSVLLHAWELNRDWFGGPAQLAKLSAQQYAGDSDVRQFLYSMSTHPDFASTLRWWHGNWAGQFYYWRPLTSLAFWAEYRLFGPDHIERWQAAMMVSHLLFVAVFVALVLRLTKSRAVALFAVLLFSGSESLWPMTWICSALSSTVAGYAPRHVGADVASTMWKDLPESWTGICIFAAALLSMGRRWIGALAFAAVAVTLKESGWLAFLILGAAMTFAWWHGALIQKPAIAAGVVVAALVALRWSAGTQVFFGARAHSNREWFVRVVGDVGGFNFEQLLFGRTLEIVSGFALALILEYGRFRWSSWIAALGVFAATVGGIAAMSHVPVDTALAMALSPDLSLGYILSGLIFGLLAYPTLALESGRRAAAVFFAGVVLTALPGAFVLQTNSHMLYLTNALAAALVAVSLEAAWFWHAALAMPKKRHRERFARPDAAYRR